MKAMLSVLAVFVVLVLFVVACAPAPAPTTVPPTAVPVPTAAPASSPASSVASATAAPKPTTAPTTAAVTTTAPAGSSATSVASATAAPKPTTAPTTAAVATTAPAGARSGGVLRLGQNAADVGNLDPHFATTTQDRSVVDMVFNALIRYKPGDGTAFEPDLATALPEPKMDGGKQTWTFTLRKGVMCQPTEGVPSYELTSDDVVYSFKKAANKDTSAYAGDYTGMTFEAVDPSTVRITLSSPISKNLFYPRVANYSGGFVVCRKAAEKLGPDKIKTNPVGTGPFMFKSYTAKEKTTLVAYDNYFRGKPQLDGFEMLYMADLSSRELGLRGGQLNVINGAPDKAWVDTIAKVANVKVDVFGVGEVATLYFNLNAPPMDKLPVRQAIAYALNRDEFLAFVGPVVGANVYSVVPAQFLAGGLTQQEVTAKGLDYATNIDKAKKLLADAGFPNGFSIKLVTSEMTGYKVIYESLQAQLAKVGIKVDVQLIDHTSYHSTIRNDANALVVYIAWRPSADSYLTRFLHSDSIIITGKNPDTNFVHYNKIDKLIEQARVELDADKQVDLWKQAQIQTLEDMVAYPIQYQNQVYARASNVDYGHALKSVLALYPGIDETTRFVK